MFAFILFPDSNEAHGFIGKSSHRSSIVDIYLLPFDKDQTTQYIATFAERFQDLFPGWDKRRYEQALQSFPGLHTFLSEPLLLFMVLNVLPLMSASVTGGGNHNVIGTHVLRLDREMLEVDQLDSEDDKFAVFSRAELYSVFAYSWVCREVCRLGGDFVEKELDENGNSKPKPEAVRSVLDFCQKLAFEMFLHNTVALELPPDTIGGPVPEAAVVDVFSSAYKKQQKRLAEAAQIQDALPISVRNLLESSYATM